MPPRPPGVNLVRARLTPGGLGGAARSPQPFLPYKLQLILRGLNVILQTPARAELIL